jgi:hypothetical protein
MSAVFSEEEIVLRANARPRSAFRAAQCRVDVRLGQSETVDVDVAAAFRDPLARKTDEPLDERRSAAGESQVSRTESAAGARANRPHRSSCARLNSKKRGYPCAREARTTQQRDAAVGRAPGGRRRRTCGRGTNVAVVARGAREWHAAGRRAADADTQARTRGSTCRRPGAPRRCAPHPFPYG